MTPPARPARRIRLTTDEGLIRRASIFAAGSIGRPRPSIGAGFVGGEGAGVISRPSVPQRQKARCEAVPEGGDPRFVRGAIRPCSAATAYGPSSVRQARAPRGRGTCPRARKPLKLPAIA